MASVTVGTGGGELLLLAGGNRGIGRGDGDRHQSWRGDRQSCGAGDGARSGVNRGRTGGDGSGQSTRADGSDGSGAGGPGGGGGEVLMAAVTVGTSGGELLLLSGGDRRIGRGDGDRHQHGGSHREGCGSVHRTRSGLNGGGTDGNCAAHTATANGSDGSDAGDPGGGIREIRVTAVTVGSGGGELLLLTISDRRIGRGDCKRHQRRRAGWPERRHHVGKGITGPNKVSSCGRGGCLCPIFGPP